MIDKKTKQRFLQELEKIGNVMHASKKVGIPFTSTVYRWADRDAEFRKRMDDAQRIGRLNIVDIAEGGLVRKAGEGDLKAATYILSRNSPHYRQTRDKYIFEYRNDKPSEKPPPTLEDMLDHFAVNAREQAERQKQEEREKELNATAHALPRKPNGDLITPWEVREWGEQVHQWRKELRTAMENGTPLPSDIMRPITDTKPPGEGLG